MTATSSGGSHVEAKDDLDDGFQYVRSRRRPRATAAAAAGLQSVSSSNTNITGASSGFAYASAPRRRGGRGMARAENDEETQRNVVERAVGAVDVFARYLGSQLASASGRDEPQRTTTFADQIADSIRTVWPSAGRMRTASGADHEAQSICASKRAAQVGEQEASKLQADEPQRGSTAVVPRRIICLGLGSPTSSRSAQIQLGLLLVIHSWLSQLHTRPACSASSTARIPEHSGAIECIAYDPVFTAQDRELLERYAIRIAPSNATRSDDEPGASIESFYTRICEPTLLYMPHCDRALYESVLSVNFGSDCDRTSQLCAHHHTSTRPLVLLSNVLSRYLITSANSELRSSAPTLNRLIPQMHVYHLPNWEQTKRSAPLTHHAQLQPEHNTANPAVQFARLWDRNALRDLAFHWL